MRVFFMALILFSGRITFAQSNDEVRSVLEINFSDFLSKDRAVCKNQIDTFHLKMISQILCGRIVYIHEERNTYLKVLDSLVFSADEITGIENSLRTPTTNQWIKNFVPNATIIPCDSRPEKAPTELYTFSKPYFLRDNTVCIFYESLSNPSFGVGGYGAFLIYRKEKGKWVLVAEPYSWIS